MGIASVWLLDRLDYHGWLAMDWTWSLLGAVGAYAFFWALSRGWYLIFGSEGFAMGDTRMVAMITAFVGPLPGALIIMLVASFLGAGMGLAVLALKGRQYYLPFGPSLAASAIFYVLYGDVVIGRWLPSYAGLI